MRVIHHPTIAVNMVIVPAWVEIRVEQLQR
jgi:hypothetical protein